MYLYLCVFMACAMGFAGIICVFTQSTPFNATVPIIAMVALFSIAINRKIKMNLKDLEVNSER